MRKLVNGLHKALMNMALLILDYMPWAVIALLANTIAQKGLDSILSVVHFIFCIVFSDYCTVYYSINSIECKWHKSYCIHEKIISPAHFSFYFSF